MGPRGAEVKEAARSYALLPICHYRYGLLAKLTFTNNDKKAELSQSWPCDAPYVGALKISGVADYAHGYFTRTS